MRLFLVAGADRKSADAANVNIGALARGDKLANERPEFFVDGSERNGYSRNLS